MLSCRRIAEYLGQMRKYLPLKMPGAIIFVATPMLWRLLIFRQSFERVFRIGADDMIGYILNAIRRQCDFSADMMAAALCLQRPDYDDLEKGKRVATTEERQLIESLCANLCIAL